MLPARRPQDQLGRSRMGAQRPAAIHTITKDSVPPAAQMILGNCAPEQLKPLAGSRSLRDTCDMFEEMCKLGEHIVCSMTLEGKRPSSAR